MEKLRPRLLRTYGGRRGRGGLRLRRVAPATPWISPQVDPRRYFSSTSSSGGGGGASSLLDDPDFLPPSPPRRRLRKRAKENRAPPKGPGPAECALPPSPLRRNVTHRQRPPARRKSGLHLRPPLVCSTPQLPGERRPGHRLSAACRCSSPDSRRESLRVDSRSPCDGLFELSLLNMDQDGFEQGTASSLELFGSEEAGRPLCECPQEGPELQCPATRTIQSGLRLSSSTPIRSHFVLQARSIFSKTEAQLRDWERLAVSPDNAASLPSQGHHLQEADQDHSIKLPVSGKSPMTPQRPLQGAFQLQASVCDGKIALSLPKEAETFDKKKRRISVQAGITPHTRVGGLNGVLSEEWNDFSLVENSPQLQPVVILDNQVVPNWLASKCTKKQAMGLSPEREYALQPDFPCAISGVTDTINVSQVVPTCGEGATGRKACISGFSSRRWGQRGKLGQGRHKKNAKWEQGNATLLQDNLKWNEMKNNSAFSSLLPSGSSVKNSNLWRRIRASLSLHKKKKIRTEDESFNCSMLSTSPNKSLRVGSLKTPFTQKLGYSICPTSSMVLLSSMKSFSIAEEILTDAEKVYGECQQEGPISFEECIAPEKMQKCEKIGEGVFGEVFKIEGEKGAVALKIIPIEGSTKVNGEAQKTFSEILPEIIISKELSLLAEGEVNGTSGFISLYSVHCVQGAYPEHLLKAWDKYHRLRVSENDRPDFFRDQQLFMVLEFQFGGTDLENMRNRQLNSVMAAKSILHQITASLAVAEEALQFEHRDLHWGNVLVKKTTLKELSYKLKGESHTLSTQGVLVNIIDYTFSRLEKDGLTVYCDLSTDEEVFQGRGDYQFDVYRQMREENLNNWSDYFPHSNILWLHYLADKLLKAVSYKKKPISSSMRKVQKQLASLSEEVLAFSSATELLNTSTFFH